MSLFLSLYVRVVLVLRPVSRSLLCMGLPVVPLCFAPWILSKNRLPALFFACLYCRPCRGAGGAAVLVAFICCALLAAVYPVSPDVMISCEAAVVGATGRRASSRLVVPCRASLACLSFAAVVLLLLLLKKPLASFFLS